MPATSTHNITFRLTLADAYDGVLRVLTDAQRFGLDLVSLALQPGGNGGELAIAMSSPAPVDLDLLALRFARHPAVLCVNSIPVGDALKVMAG
jgi:hypothetical protein